MELVFFTEDDRSRTDLDSLHEWLKRTDQLSRSPVDLVPRPPAPGEMGGVSDLVVHLDVVEVAAFVSAVTAWLRFRGVDLDIERSADGGVRARVRRAKRADTDRLVERLTEALRPDGEAQADAPESEDVTGAG